MSVISTASNTVIESITVGTNPFGIAISPSGNNVYVANQGSNSISIINVASFSATTITTGVGSEPIGIAVTPDNAYFYVTNYSGGTVSVFSAATGSLVTTITVGTDPYGIAISPNGSHVYAANYGSNSVSVIDTSTNTVSATITSGVGTEPLGIAVSPNGSTLWVTNYSSGTVSIFNTSTNALITTVTVGTNPYGISFTPDGGTVYVVNYGSNSVSVINASSHSVSTTISFPSGSNPSGFGQFIQPRSLPMTSLYVAPQGRLTLTSNTPVMTNDVTSATSVYYTPYLGNIVPIYDGANMQSYTFSQLTMTLNTSNQLSGNIYDLFIFLNSGTVTIGAGSAWSNSGTGTSSRGTGAGTTQLQQTDGLWGNANTITLTNGITTYSSIPVGEATYVGSVYMTANGQTGIALKPAAGVGGSANIVGLFNAYNRVKATAISRDSNDNWTYATAAWRPADGAGGNTNNRINWVDGLQQINVKSIYVVAIGQSTSGNEAYVGTLLNATSGTPNISNVSSGPAGDIYNVFCVEPFYPQLGFNYIQAMENAISSTNVTFYSGSVFQNLEWDGEI